MPDSELLAAINAQLLLDMEAAVCRAYSKREVDNVVHLLVAAKDEIERQNICMHALRCEIERLYRQINEWQGHEVQITKKVRLVEP